MPPPCCAPVPCARPQQRDAFQHLHTSTARPKQYLAGGRTGAKGSAAVPGRAARPSHHVRDLSAFNAFKVCAPRLPGCRQAHAVLLRRWQAERLPSQRQPHPRHGVLCPGPYQGGRKDIYAGLEVGELLSIAGPEARGPRHGGRGLGGLPPATRRCCTASAPVCMPPFTSAARAYPPALLAPLQRHQVHVPEQERQRGPPPAGCGRPRRCGQICCARPQPCSGVRCLRRRSVRQTPARQSGPYPWSCIPLGRPRYQLVSIPTTHDDRPPDPPLS